MGSKLYGAALLEHPPNKRSSPGEKALGFGDAVRCFLTRTAPRPACKQASFDTGSCYKRSQPTTAQIASPVLAAGTRHIGMHKFHLAL